MMEMIRVENLEKSYKIRNISQNGEEAIPVIKGIDFTVEEGEYVAIMGKSGCGKTTLLKMLGFLERPTCGKLWFEGTDTKNLWRDQMADLRRREIGYVFQDFYLMDSLTVKENIMLPSLMDKRPLEECKQKRDRLAERFGIHHLLNKNPFELSGGERQRVAICRALMNDPKIILADEPTGNLDSKSGQVVMEEFQKINEELKKTILMVTHDPKMASSCKRVLFLKDGVIMDDIKREASEEEFYEAIIRRMKEF